MYYTSFPGAVQSYPELYKSVQRYTELHRVELDYNNPFHTTYVTFTSNT